MPKIEESLTPYQIAFLLQEKKLQEAIENLNKATEKANKTIENELKKLKNQDDAEE